MGGEETKNNIKGKDFGTEIIDSFTREELKDTLIKVDLVIRPLKNFGLIKATDYIPPLNIIKEISRGIKGNQGISTQPYHWGLIFETKTNKLISCQYPPIKIKKGINFEDCLAHILEGTDKNKIKDLEKTKRKFGGLKIKKEINIEELIELSKRVIKKKYTALKDNCQKFCSDILSEICSKDINEIRISGNYCLFTDEEKVILSKNSIQEYIKKLQDKYEDEIDNLPHEEWNQESIENAEYEVFNGIIEIKQLIIEETLKGNNEEEIFKKADILDEKIISIIGKYYDEEPPDIDLEDLSYSNSEEREDWDSFDYDIRY